MRRPHKPADGEIQAPIAAPGLLGTSVTEVRPARTKLLGYLAILGTASLLVASIIKTTGENATHESLFGSDCNGDRVDKFEHEPQVPQLNDNVPVLHEGQPVAAAEVEQYLRENHHVRLSHSIVQGPFSFYMDKDYGDTLSAENVTFTDSVTVNGVTRLTLVDSTVVGRAVLSGSDSDADVNIAGSRFESDVDLSGGEEYAVRLNGTTFMGNLTFAGAKAVGVSLEQARFEKSVDFSGSIICLLVLDGLTTDKPIGIRWSQFSPRTIKDLTTEFGQLGPRAENQEVESRLAFWKKNFKDLGLEQDARQANHELLKWKQEHVLTAWDPEFWVDLALVQLRIASSPYTPVLLGLLIIEAYGLWYAWRDPFVRLPDKEARSKAPILLFALAYSLDTFIPLLSTGVKDWGWEIRDGPDLWIELSERMAGLLVIALTAYSISSYVL